MQSNNTAICGDRKGVRQLFASSLKHHVSDISDSALVVHVSPQDFPSVSVYAARASCWGNFYADGSRPASDIVLYCSDNRIVVAFRGLRLVDITCGVRPRKLRRFVK